MKRESMILLINLYLEIQSGIRATLKVLVGESLTMVGYEEGFLGSLTKIEKVFKNECHPSFLDCDEDGCDYWSVVLDDSNLSAEDKADILMNPRNSKAY